MRDAPDLLSRIYRLKLLLTGAALLLLSLLATSLGNWLDEHNANHLLIAIVQGLSDVFLVTGAIGIAVDFFTGKDKDAADTERLRNLLKEAAPEFRDAVIAGFVETPENMRGVATDATLDKLATNALALRLGDEKFAAEIYAGLLAQAIRTPERWSDVDINVRLSSIEERSTVGAPRSKPLPAPLFDVVVTWEYTVIPSARIRKFAATNSLDEFHELLDEVPSTQAWYITPTTADAREKAAFEVLSYSVDGVDSSIHRRERKSGQLYTVDLGDVTVIEQKPVRIRQVYRTVIRQSGHRFRIALAQPTHGMRLVMDYTDSGIAEMKVGELISGAVGSQVNFLPEGAPAKQVEVAAPGWLLPQAEVTFVWTLEDELPDHKLLRTDADAA